MGPTKRFSSSDKYLRNRRLPNISGTGPDSWLLPRPNARSRRSPAHALPIGPDSWLSRRSRYSSESASPSRKASGTGPEAASRHRCDDAGLVPGALSHSKECSLDLFLHACSVPSETAVADQPCLLGPSQAVQWPLPHRPWRTRPQSR